MLEPRKHNCNCPLPTSNYYSSDNCKQSYCSVTLCSRKIISLKKNKQRNAILIKLTESESNRPESAGHSTKWLVLLLLTAWCSLRNLLQFSSTSPKLTISRESKKERDIKIADVILVIAGNKRKSEIEISFFCPSYRVKRYFSLMFCPTAQVAFRMQPNQDVLIKIGRFKWYAKHCWKERREKLLLHKHSTTNNSKQNSHKHFKQLIPYFHRSRTATLYSNKESEKWQLVHLQLNKTYYRTSNKQNDSLLLIFIHSMLQGQLCCLHRP